MNSGNPQASVADGVFCSLSELAAPAASGLVRHFHEASQVKLIGTL